MLSLSADGAVSQPKALQGQRKGFDLYVQRGLTAISIAALEERLAS